MVALEKGGNMDEIQPTDAAVANPTEAPLEAEAGADFGQLFADNFGNTFIEAIVMPLVKKHTDEIVSEMRNS